MRGSKSEVGEVTIEDPLDPNLLTYSPRYQGGIYQYFELLTNSYCFCENNMYGRRSIEGLLNRPNGASHRDSGHYDGVCLEVVVKMVVMVVGTGR